MRGSKWLLLLAGLGLAGMTNVMLAQEKKPEGKPAAKPEGKPAAKPEGKDAKGHEKHDDDHKHAAHLPNCPVMDEPIDLTLSIKTDEGIVYFCCDKCIRKYQNDKAKYADKVKEQRAALAKLPRVQVACPMTGRPVVKEAFLEKDGKKVYFCCTGCPGRFEKDEKSAAKLDACYTYQTKCPVDGGDIDIAQFAETSGGYRIYFSSKDCKETFLKTPDKYLEKLEDMGIFVEADDIKKDKGAAKP